MPLPKFWKDSDVKVTVGEIIRQMADHLDKGNTAGACTVLEELFLDGSWGHIFDKTLPDIVTCRADILGLMTAAYKLGKGRATLLKDGEPRLEKASEGKEADVQGVDPDVR